MAKDKIIEAEAETEVVEAQPEVESNTTVEKIEPGAEVTEPEKPIGFVLKKSHGLIINGRTSKHFPAGAAFDEARDAETISLLVKSGAQFE